MLSDFFIEHIFPSIISFYDKMQSKRTGHIKAQLEESFVFWEKKRLMLVYLSPVIFAGAGFILSQHILGALAGFLVGIAFPGFMVKMAYQNRIKKFQGQLVDGLSMLSSSLKAGLSFIQAIEVLCEEMPPPISQEFKLILKENKWGMSLEESLIKLRKRIPLEESNLLVSSILIARESGGELPKVLLRLTSTIRDNIKLKEKISTLTLQGRLQGLIMMFLPVGFSYFIYKQNPDHFTIMWQNSTGRLFVIIAICLQIAGMIIIKKVSTIRI
ncbi:MAG: type II secretion system F family protein [Candidatus Omnitrophica bacterium]|jgi:tight adherence protein B|nr:type II secretion system F family protein [Candidatus Omnitrophota bacterium]